MHLHGSSDLVQYKYTHDYQVRYLDDAVVLFVMYIYIKKKIYLKKKVIYLWYNILANLTNVYMIYQLVLKSLN